MNSFEDYTDKPWATGWKTRWNICMVEKKHVLCFSCAQVLRWVAGAPWILGFFRAPAWGWVINRDTRHQNTETLQTLGQQSFWAILIIYLCSSPTKSWYPGWNLQWPSSQSRATRAVTLRFHKISTVGGRACNLWADFFAVKASLVEIWRQITESNESNVCRDLIQSDFFPFTGCIGSLRMTCPSSHDFFALTIRLLVVWRFYGLPM